LAHSQGIDPNSRKPGTVEFPGLDKPIDPDHRHVSNVPNVITNPNRNQHFVILTTPAGKTHNAKLFELWHVRQQAGGGFAIDVSYLAEEVRAIPAGSRVDVVVDPQRALDSDFAFQGRLRLPGQKKIVPVIVLLAK
jgi:hypothetical protein